MRGSRAVSLALIATFSIAAATGLSAHRRDEFLQAARIGVEPDRVRIEVSLTPGIAVADGVIRDIDDDGDGALSPAEQQRYLQGVVSRLALRVDDSAPLRLSLVESSVPDGAAMRTGEAAIALVVEAAMPTLGTGAHRIVFRNNNARNDSVYLANALVPESDRVAITGQQRDFNQKELTVEFSTRESRRSGGGGVWFGLAVVLFARVYRRRNPSCTSV